MTAIDTPINLKISIGSLEIPMIQEVCIKFYGGGTSPKIHFFVHALLHEAAKAGFDICIVESIAIINILVLQYMLR